LHPSKGAGLRSGRLRECGVMMLVVKVGIFPAGADMRPWKGIGQ
jgi:hypothetical protein